MPDVMNDPAMYFYRTVKNQKTHDRNRALLSAAGKGCSITKNVLTLTALGGAAATAGMSFGFVGLALGILKAGADHRSYRKTRKHVDQLVAILNKPDLRFDCPDCKLKNTANQSGVNTKAEHNTEIWEKVLPYVIRQKRNKKLRMNMSRTVIGGFYEPIVKIKHRLQKTHNNTRGIDRTRNAQILADHFLKYSEPQLGQGKINIQYNCKLSYEIVAELLGEDVVDTAVFLSVDQLASILELKTRSF